MSIDLDFRPDSYADFDNPVSVALNGILGHNRRAMVRDMLTATGPDRDRIDALGPIEPEILQERADEDFIQNLTDV